MMLTHKYLHQDFIVKVRLEPSIHGKETVPTPMDDSNPNFSTLPPS